MPVYEYECPSCDKVFEVQQRISDAPLSTCPECGGDVKKLVSMSSFQLKGGGWYSDGYSSASSAKDKKSSTPAKETKAPPPCRGGEGDSCKHCPASAG